MPAVQTTYAARPAAGFPGMIADQGLKNIVSRTVEGTIGFGKPAYRGTSEGTIAATGSVFVGVTVADPTQPADAYAAGATAAVMTQGPIFVLGSDAAVVADAGTLAHYDHTAAATDLVKLRFVS